MFGDGSIDLADPPAAAAEEGRKPPPAAGGSVEGSTSNSVASSKSKKINPNYGAIRGSPSEEKIEEGTNEVLLNQDEAKYVKAKMVDTESLKPHMPRYNPCLWLFHLLEGVTAVVCACLFVTQILPFFVLRFRDIGLLATMLKIYIALFSLLFVLTETGAPVPILRHSPLLQPYASRGFLYSFLGLIGVQEAYSERVRDVMKAHGDEFHISWAPLFLQVTAWLVLSSGVVYLVLGICCLQRVRDRLHQNELDAWRQYRVDLREWQQRFG